MTNPQNRDGRQHETELYDYPHITYPFNSRPVPDVANRQYERKYFVEPAKYAPKIANRVMNLIPRSNKFSTGWTLNDVTVTPNADANPWDSTQTVDLITEAATTAAHCVLAPTVSFGAGGYILWAIVKPVGRDWFYLESAVNGKLCFFNLATLSVGTALGCTGLTPVALANGYFRIAIVTPTMAGPDNIMVGCSTADATPSHAGSTSCGFYLAQVQMELGATPGQLLITTGTPVSRRPEVDPLDPAAYLCVESNMQHTAKDAAQVIRIFSNIPGNQVSYEKRPFNRPSLSGYKGSTYWGVSFDDDETTALFAAAARKVVSQVSSHASTTTAVPLTNSNVTLVDSGGHSVSFQANAVASFVVSTCNAGLTSMSGFSANNTTGTLSIFWVSGSLSSVTVPSGVGYTIAGNFLYIVATAGNLTTSATTQIQASGHGGAVGDRVAIWAGDALVGTAPVRTVLDADNFLIMTDDVSVAGQIITHCAFADTASVRYVNGMKDCDVKITERYFLPGVTSGINSGADYPTTAFYTDPISWLTAIETSLTYAAISAQQGQYLGPILMNTIAEVEMADALESRSVSA